MKYENVKKAEFLERPNRFLAKVRLDGRESMVHVKNTGRCKELLVPGAEVYVEPASNPERKTQFSLIAVKKGQRLINMDSQVPNHVVYEALEGGLTLPGLQGPVKSIRREVKYGTSRFDLYIETDEEKAFIEVKGVTLEEGNVAMFPDAPTERGVKHVYELVKAIKDGYAAYAIFVIQMEDILSFTPNYKTHAEFGEALKYARAQGVHILAYESVVEPDEIILGKCIKKIDLET